MEQILDEERQLLARPQCLFKEDPYRFVILTLFCISTFMVSLSFYGFSSVATQVSDLYGVSLFLINFYSSGYMIINLVFGVPLAYVLSYYRVRTNIALMITSGVLGAWLRCFLNSSFYFALFGHLLLGFSFSFYRSIIPRISSIWFAPQKRATSSAFMLAFLLTADAFSLYLPSLVINKNMIPPDEFSYYKNRLFLYFLIYAIVATVFGIPVVIFFREKPRFPVSITATMPRLQFCASFKPLINNFSFLALSFITSISVALTVGYSIVMREALKNYGISSKIIGVSGLISMAFVGPVPLIVSHIAGKYNKFKLSIIIFTFFSCAAFTILLFALPLKSGLIFGLVQIMCSISVGVIVSIGLQFGAEMGFPVPQAFTGSFLVIGMKLMTVIIVLCSTALINNSQIYELTVMFFTLQLICCFIVFFISDVLKRRRIDLNEGPEELPNEHITALS